MQKTFFAFALCLFCLFATLWLSKELVPLNAEISCDEKTVAFIEITDWSVS